MKKKFIIHKKQQRVIEINYAEKAIGSQKSNPNSETLSIIKNQLLSDLNKMDILIKNHFNK